MMDEERLDNDLRDRISEVFDNYEDTGADEGWALLRQKYPPQEEKNRGLAWLWYAAAAVVILGLGLWMLQKPAKPDQLMVKQPKPALQTSPVIKQAPVIHKDTIQNSLAQNQVNIATNTAIPVPANHQPVIDTTTTNAGATPATNGKQPVKVPFVKTIQASGLAANNKQNIKNPANAAGQTGAGNMPSAVNQPVNASALAASGGQRQSLAAKDSINKPAVLAANKNNPANSTNQNQPAQLSRTDSTKKAATYMAQNQAPNQATKNANEKAFNSLFEGKNAPAMKEDRTVMKGSKKAMFSVYAATYFNYAKGSDNQMNVGAGFTSDFKLSSKLKLSTGVAVGQNSLSYANTPAQNNSGNLAYARESAPVSNYSSISLTNAVVPAPKANIPSKYNASLVGLDIPVNLKYQFNPQTDTYVAAGLSSGTFINETYQSVYTNTANATTSVQNTGHASFNNFDFAKTLNVSFGMGYPLGKSNRLIVEPFLKYPLDGLGSQQLKFGAGGVNLKLNFQTTKK